MWQRWGVRLAVFLAASTVTSVFFIDFCAWIFRCGCQSLWLTADKYCNIHAAHAGHGAKGCPWCSFGYAGYLLVFGSMVAAQAVVAFLAPWNWPARLGAALAVFPLMGFVLAGITGVWTGYWR
ncbi:MAG: hypothetical protein FJW31_18600 [Acidobacteria bacterium]|nr:hypothetical protein [Acidobacteriota bacterium]